MPKEHSLFSKATQRSFVCVWFSFHLFLVRDGGLYIKMTYLEFLNYIKFYFCTSPA